MYIPIYLGSFWKAKEEVIFSDFVPEFRYNEQTFENYKIWCKVKINYEQIISISVKHKIHELKCYNTWMNDIIPYYVIPYTSRLYTFWKWDIQKI